MSQTTTFTKKNKWKTCPISKDEVRMKLGLSSMTKEMILLKNIFSLLDKILHQHKNNKMLISIQWMMNLTTPMMTQMSQPMSKFTNQL